MEKKFFGETNELFLIAFTEELIINSIRNNQIILRQIEEIKERTIGRVLEIEIPKQIQKITPHPIVQKKMPIVKQLRKPILEIPEPALPMHLQYLKPIPTNIDIDLYKITPLIKDPTVRIIEGNPDEAVIVVGTRGTKQTDIVLNKEDIERIISKFSEVSKIPVNEGVYRIVIGNLSISAIISRTIGSKFLIKKLAYPITNQQMRYSH